MVTTNFSRTPHVLKVSNATPLCIHVILAIIIPHVLTRQHKGIDTEGTICRNSSLSNHQISRQEFLIACCNDRYYYRVS